MLNQDTLTGNSFSFNNRLARLVWGTVYLLLFRYSPIPFHGWRSFLLRVFGAKVGHGARVYPKVRIWAPWNIKLGDQCGIANYANLYAQGKIEIGRRTTVSQGVHLCAGTHDYSKPGFPTITKPIYIGSYAWIAAESFIHPGINIGEGCVIGARSVVTKDMPSWTVCTGHPCIPIKERVTEEMKREFELM